jgi:hypothetical protein
VSAHETSITTLIGSVSAHESSITALNGSVSGLSGSVSTLNSRLNTLSYSDLNGTLPNSDIAVKELGADKTFYNTGAKTPIGGSIYPSDTLGLELDYQNRNFFDLISSTYALASMAGAINTAIGDPLSITSIASIVAEQAIQNQRLFDLDAPVSGRVSVNEDAISTLSSSVGILETRTTGLDRVGTISTISGDINITGSIVNSGFTYLEDSVGLLQGKTTEITYDDVNTITSITNNVSVGNNLVVNGSVINNEIQNATSNILGIHSNIQSITFTGGTTTIDGKSNIYLDFLKLANKEPASLPAPDANFVHIAWDRNALTEQNRPSIFYEDPDSPGTIAYVLDTENVAFLDGYTLPTSVIPDLSATKITSGSLNITGTISATGDISGLTLRAESALPQVVLNAVGGGAPCAVRFGNSAHEIARGGAYGTPLNGSDDMAVWSSSDRVGLINSNGYALIQTNGDFETNKNINGDSYIGKVAVGGITGDAYFSHHDLAGSASACALAQSSVGATRLNAAILSSISFTINNVGVGTIDSGGLSVLSDTDATTILGRLRIRSAESDHAQISHYDYSGTNNYGFKQQANGNTYLNAVGGQFVFILEGDNDGFRFNPSACRLESFGRGWPTFNFNLPAGISGTGSGAFLCYSSSSQDTKKDIEDLEIDRTINIVENCRPRWFRYNNIPVEDPRHLWGAYGLIAEELEIVDRRLVAYGDPEGTTPASVYYDKLGLHAVHYIQKVLNPKIASLEAKIDSILNRLDG